MIEVDEIHYIHGIECHLLYESNSVFWKVWSEGLGYLGLGTSKSEALADAYTHPKMIVIGSTVTSGCAVQL